LYARLLEGAMQWEEREIRKKKRKEFRLVDHLSKTP
jgi:hypothetical protein